MIEVRLGGKRGGIAIVDDADDWVMAFSWHPHTRGYAQRAGPRRADGRKTIITLHRELMGFPDGLVDHINRDRMDNRRVNLRVVTAAENAQNRSSHPGTSSNYRNVHRVGQRWIAAVEMNNKQIYLGRFDHEIDAARVAQEYRLAHMPGATD